MSAKILLQLYVVNIYFLRRFSFVLCQPGVADGRHRF